MAEQVYDWKRFWCPRSSQINLGDWGYLTDPESEYGKHANPDLVGLETIASSRLALSDSEDLFLTQPCDEVEVNEYAQASNNSLRAGKKLNKLKH